MHNLIMVFTIVLLVILLTCTPNTPWVSMLGGTFGDFFKFCQDNQPFSGIIILVIGISAFMTKPKY